MTATPSVPPSSRVVLFTAAPAPICSGVSALMTASVAGAVLNDRPSAKHTIESRIHPKYGASGVPFSATITSPAAMDRRPIPDTRRIPTLSARIAPIGVKTAETMAKGSVCTPADKVE